MGLITMIAVFLLAVFAIVIVFKLWKAFMLTVLVLLLAALSAYWLPIVFLKSTDLTGEGFNQTAAGSAVKEEDMISREDNVMYSALKSNPNILLRVKNGEIMEMATAGESADASVSTMKGITKAHTFEDVIQQYGSSYRKLRLVEMYGTGIEYRDKKNGIVIEFYFDDEGKNSKVRHMEIRKK